MNDDLYNELNWLLGICLLIWLWMCVILYLTYPLWS